MEGQHSIDCLNIIDFFSPYPHAIFTIIHQNLQQLLKMKEWKELDKTEFS